MYLEDFAAWEIIARVNFVIGLHRSCSGNQRCQVTVEVDLCFAVAYLKYSTTPTED
jgi:hypothetical protein